MGPRTCSSPTPWSFWPASRTSMFVSLKPIVPIRAHFGPAMETTGEHSVRPYPSSTEIPSRLYPCSTCVGHGAPPTIMKRSLPPRPFIIRRLTTNPSPAPMSSRAARDAFMVASILSNIFSARSGTLMTTVGRSSLTSSPMV